MIRFSIIFLVILSVIYSSRASLIRNNESNAEKITNCKVKLAENQIVDLTSLDNAAKPRFIPITF